MLISHGYRAQNAQMHRENPAFGNSGSKWALVIDPLARSLGCSTLLDYGCGRGTLATALTAAPYAVREYDPAIPGKDEPPEPADLVVCTDVLEHIEPECLDDVLADLARLSRKATWMVIATQPAMKALPDGRNAHLIVEPVGWWIGKIEANWRWRSFTNYGAAFQCTATPK